MLAVGLLKLYRNGTNIVLSFLSIRSWVRPSLHLQQPLYVWTVWNTVTKSRLPTIPSALSPVVPCPTCGTSVAKGISRIFQWTFDSWGIIILHLPKLSNMYSITINTRTNRDTSYHQTWRYWPQVTGASGKYEVKWVMTPRIPQVLEHSLVTIVEIQWWSKRYLTSQIDPNRFTSRARWKIVKMDPISQICVATSVSRWQVVTSGDSPGDRWQMLRFPREVVGPQRLVEFCHRDVLGVVFLVMAFDSQWPWHGVRPPREVTSASDIELCLLAGHGSESEIIWIFADLQEGRVQLGLTCFLWQIHGTLHWPYMSRLVNLSERMANTTELIVHPSLQPGKQYRGDVHSKSCSYMKTSRIHTNFSSYLKSQAQFPIQAPSGKLLLPLVEVQLCSAQVSRTADRDGASTWSVARLEMRQIFRPLGPLQQKMDKCWVSLSKPKPSQGKFMEPGCRFRGCQKICQEISIKPS